MPLYIHYQSQRQQPPPHNHAGGGPAAAAGMPPIARNPAAGPAAGPAGPAGAALPPSLPHSLTPSRGATTAGDIDKEARRIEMQRQFQQYIANKSKSTTLPPSAAPSRTPPP